MSEPFERMSSMEIGIEILNAQRLAQQGGKWHELKVEWVYFKHLLNGSKAFEVRKNDRDYKVGDYLILREYGVPPNFPLFNAGTSCTFCGTGPQGYSGRAVTRRIDFVLREHAALAEGYVALGITPA